MIYKKDRKKDFIFLLDWLMVVFIFVLFMNALPTLQVDNWGLDSWYMHKLLILGIGYMCFRLYINQSRMYKILTDKLNDVKVATGEGDGNG